MSLATLTHSGRAGMAQALAAMPLHFAWGSGNAAWDDDPTAQHLAQSLVEAVALNNELGRRAVTAIGYVTPDPEGEITVPVGRQPDGAVVEARYRAVLEPTPFLYLRANFDFADASDQVVREVGVFLNTATRADLPPGQRYFTPDQLDDAGRLLAIQRMDPVIVRSPAVRQTFDFVLAI
ncbi:hypothetical protein [Megalodesulfovibrio paquesii]